MAKGRHVSNLRRRLGRLLFSSHSEFDEVRDKGGDGAFISASFSGAL
jgi:hypothetical protein